MGAWWTGDPYQWWKCWAHGGGLVAVVVNGGDCDGNDGFTGQMTSDRLFQGDF